VEQWEAAREGHVNWEGLFRGYRAAVDWPTAAFYEDLMEKYPDAKVILTVRDPDKWYIGGASLITLTLLYLRSRTSPRRA
jgi:hypothetical protein